RSADREDGAAASSRGTIFAIGGSFLNFETDFGNAILVEVDPRTNYLANIFSAQDGDFTPNSSTQNSDGVDITTLNQVVGMTYVGNTLVMTAINYSGDRVLVQYSPSATNGPTDPRVRRLDRVPMGNTFFGLAANTSGNPMASVTLSDPTGPLEPGGFIPPVFAAMAYSAQAANSVAFVGIMKERVVASSADAAGCAMSAELNGTDFRTSIGQFVNQRMGVSQAIRNFRDNLPPGHPCERPGI
ncbi:MAG: hypothetical protein ACT4PL_04745, partial [Phycisphaerales bacterium]